MIGYLNLYLLGILAWSSSALTALRSYPIRTLPIRQSLRAVDRGVLGVT